MLLTFDQSPGYSRASVKLPALQLADVDDALSRLLCPLEAAVSACRLVVAHSLWRPVPYVALLPHHLHLCWPDRIKSLPMNVQFAVVPFLARDSELMNIPLYSPGAAREARRIARYKRHKEQRNLSFDFVHADWEEGFARNRSHLKGKNLSASSFVAVDVVTSTGEIVRGRRPVLGRIASRRDLRPSILVPGKRNITQKTHESLAKADVLLINLQQIRGHRTLEVIREVLRHRGHHLPGLIVTSSPNELRNLGLDNLGQEVIHQTVGKAPSLHEVRISVVDQDRLQAEREFEFAVTEVRGHSEQLDHLADLAKAAWWAIRQSLAAGDREDPAVRRFWSALDRAQREDPFEARQFTSAEKLLQCAIIDADRGRERLHQVVSAIFNNTAVDRTLVITRNRYAAVQARIAIAEAVEAQPEELEEAGIFFCAVSDSIFPRQIDRAIAYGFFGASTIDAILQSDAPLAHLVLDPIEIRAAWKATRDMIEGLGPVQCTAAKQVLEKIAKALEPHVMPYVDTMTLDLAWQTPILTTAQTGHCRTNRPGDQDTAIIYLMDGSILQVPLEAHLEVVERGGAPRLRTVTPRDLKPGDELIIVEAQAQSEFSDRLMQALDRGPLKSVAEKRSAWLTILRTIIGHKRPNLRAVHRTLKARGVEVNYQTVLSWTRPDATGEHHTPRQWQHFKAFAEVLDISLSEDLLFDYYKAIHTWRTLHRLAGRQLVRAMRSAYLGRLDATTLARIEREWGLGARELIQSTRLFEIDAVELPEGEGDANL